MREELTAAHIERKGIEVIKLNKQRIAKHLSVGLYQKPDGDCHCASHSLQMKRESRNSNIRL